MKPPFDPIITYRRIRLGDSKSEGDLAQYLTSRFKADYLKTLGPLAEDYLQDLCIRVIDCIRTNKIDHPEKLVPYCAKVASHVRIDGLRSAAGAARRLVPLDEGKNRQSSGNIESELILSEQLQTVLKLMEQLDPLSNEVIRRYYFERERAPRIQRDLGLTEDQFQRRKDGAIKKLRDDYHAMDQRWRSMRNTRSPGGLKAAA